MKVNDIKWPIPRYIDTPSGLMEEDPHGGWVHVDDVLHYMYIAMEEPTSAQSAALPGTSA